MDLPAAEVVWAVLAKMEKVQFAGQSAILLIFSSGKIACLFWKFIESVDEIRKRYLIVATT